MNEYVQSINIGYLVELIFFLTILFSGMVGNYLVIRGTQGPKEHRFMMRASCAAWTTILLCFLLAYALPSPWRFLVLIPYFLHLPVATYLTVNKQLVIRKVEETEKRGKSWETGT